MDNSDSVELSLKVYPALEITTTELPEGKVGDAYEATLEATGGKLPYSWSATGLPAGLSCSADGVISGIPTEAGDFTVTVTVTDAMDNSDTKELSITIHPPAFKIYLPIIMKNYAP